jgi:Spy/CpxP family protein refolding chaperone
MDKTDKNKWQVRAAALLGFAAGGLSLNAYFSRRGPGGPPGRHDRFEQMLNRLQLSAEQKAQVERILSDTREQLVGLRKQSEPRVEEIRRQADERLRQVLSPEQWQQFQQLKSEMRGRRRGREGEGRRPGRER